MKCICLVLLVAAVAAAGQKPPFRLLYNNDSTNVANCDSPFHQRGEPLTDEAIAGSIDEVADKGVDCYLLSPGLGHVPWWKSKLIPDHYQRWAEETGLEPGVFGQYLMDGGDFAKVLVERCRHHKMAPFVSFRLNDVHRMEYAGEQDPRSVWVSRFYRDHPEYWIEPDHKKKWKPGYHHRRGLNWAEPEVRAYKLALITELCESYDLDGFELDFLRDHVLFRDDVPRAKRIKIVTGFVRKIRAVLDRTAKPGQHRWLCVRVPLELRSWPETGLDVTRLCEAGVEMLNCSGWYHTTPIHDLAKIRKLAPDHVAVYQEMTHSAGSLHFIAPRTGYGTLGFPRTCDAQFYTTAHLAYARGADGISLFNFVYYRSGGEKLPWLRREPPFHILPHLREREWLAQQPQYYWLAQWVYGRQVRKTIEPGAAATFRFDVALPRRDLAEATRLRVHAHRPIEGDLAAAFNGTALEPTDETGPLLDNPYDRMISDAPRRRAWRLPTALGRNGRNQLRVAVSKDGRAVTLVWIDFAVE
ncbi:MAG: hypothetical protein ACODAJ_06915 [Planctomycetota bacterium]